MNALQSQEHCSARRRPYRYQDDFAAHCSLATKG